MTGSVDRSDHGPEEKCASDGAERRDDDAYSLTDAALSTEAEVGGEEAAGEGTGEGGDDVGRGTKAGALGEPAGKPADGDTDQDPGNPDVARLHERSSLDSMPGAGNKEESSLRDCRDFPDMLPRRSALNILPDVFGRTLFGRANDALFLLTAHSFRLRELAWPPPNVFSAAVQKEKSVSTADLSPSVVPPGSVVSSSYSYALGYLKAIIVLLVVAHHAVLAYHPAAAPIPTSLLSQPRIWQAYPVVDSQRAAWAAMFATFNDIFFMALMFFVSGLFVWKSYRRKGASAYGRDRLLRLGLPFIPAALVLAPLSYYPTYLQIQGHAGLGDFLKQWLALGTWSAGPVWFCWVLLVFDWVALAQFKRRPDCGERLGAAVGRASLSPTRFFGVLVVLTVAVYVPLALLAGPFHWIFVGPFGFQTSRLLLYFVYFAAGIGAGAWGLDRGLFAAQGELSRNWGISIGWAVLAFMAEAFALQTAVTHGPPPVLGSGVGSAAWMATLFLFPVSCAASSLAFVAIFLRFFHTRLKMLESLSRNAYGIFLLHFVFVSWFGYLMLPAAVPAFVKFLVVTAGAVGCAWGASALLRRIPRAQRVL